MEYSNELQVAFGHLKTKTTADLYRLDEDQYLVFTDIDLPEYFRTDFGLSENGYTVSMTGYNNKVLIPDELLIHPGVVHAWIWANTGISGGKTIYHAIIPVIARGSRNDVSPDPADQQQIDALIDALNDGVERAEAAASLLENVSAEATTLSPEEDATAHYADGVFTFGIPRGPQGIQGPKGDPGIIYTLEPEVSAIIYDPESSSFAPAIFSVFAWKVREGILIAPGSGWQVTINVVNAGGSVVATETTELEDEINIASITLPNSLSSGYTVTAILAEVDAPDYACKIEVPVISNGAKGNTGATGPQGPQGIQGETGATPAFAIGSVITGAAGSSAQASITGTAEEPVLNLTIPQGLKGDPGNGDMIADDFSTSKSYAAGEYAIYNGSLYRFTAAHAAGAWIGMDATAVQLGEDVVDLKNAIDNIDDVLEMPTGNKHFDATVSTPWTPTQIGSMELVNGVIYTFDFNVSSALGYVVYVDIEDQNNTSIYNSSIAADATSAKKVYACDADNVTVTFSSQIGVSTSTTINVDVTTDEKNKIEQIEDEIGNDERNISLLTRGVTDEKTDVLTWETGTISEQYGVGVPSSSPSIRTSGYASYPFSVVADNGYKYMVFVYANDDTYLGIYNGLTYEKEVHFFTRETLIPFVSGYKYRYVLAKVDESSISTSDASHISFYERIIENVDIIGNGKKHRMIAGVIRNSGNGWEFIVDSAHQGDMNCVSVEANQDGKIVLNYSEIDAKKVISFVIVPDETFASIGYVAGSSVGLTYSLIDVYQSVPDAVCGVIGVDSEGNISISQYANGITSAVWDSTGHYMTISHDILSNEDNGYRSTGICVTPYDTGSAPFISTVFSYSNNAVILRFYDMTGNLITNLDSSINFWFSRESTTKVKQKFIDANTITNGSGNFWFMGIFEV